MRVATFPIISPLGEIENTVRNLIMIGPVGS